MRELNENEQVRLVAVQLRERYPLLDHGVIDAVVAEEHARLNGPVRAFVPLLVHRAATTRLAGLSLPSLLMRPPADPVEALVSA